MSEVIASLRRTASDLLDRYAVPVALLRVTRLYNETDRTVTEQLTAIQGRGVLVQRGDTERVEGAAEVSRLGAVVGNLSDAGYSPQVDDLLEVNGRRYRVNGSSPVQPDGIPIVWRLALDEA